MVDKWFYFSYHKYDTLTIRGYDMELIRINDAAKRLKVSRATIYHLIATSRLPVTEIAGVKFIDAANLSRPEVVNRPNGRPPITGGDKINA